MRIENKMQLFFQILCMGSFDTKWDHMPSKLALDSVVLTLAFICHVGLSIPIKCVKGQKEGQTYQSTNRSNKAEIGKFTFYAAVISLILFAQGTLIASVNS